MKEKIKKLFFKVIHTLTSLDLIARLARPFFTKFVPGYIIDIGYYTLLGIDKIAEWIDSNHNKSIKIQPQSEKGLNKLMELREKNLFSSREKRLKEIQRIKADYYAKITNSKKGKKG